MASKSVADYVPTITTRQPWPLPDEDPFQFGWSLLLRGAADASLIFVRRRFKRTLCHARHYLYFPDGWMVNLCTWNEETFYIKPQNSLSELRSRKSEPKLRYVERARFKPRRHQMALEPVASEMWREVEHCLTWANSAGNSQGLQVGKIPPDVLSRLLSRCDTQEFFGIPDKETPWERYAKGEISEDDFTLWRRTLLRA